MSDDFFVHLFQKCIIITLEERIWGMNPKENFERKQQAMKPRSSRKGPSWAGEKKRVRVGERDVGKNARVGKGEKREKRAVASNEIDHGCSLRLRC